MLFFSLVELETFTKLSDGHLLHEAVATSLGWIESLGSLDRNLLKLPNLSDELSFLGKFGSLLILTLFKSLLQVTVYLVSDLLVLFLF